MGNSVADDEFSGMYSDSSCSRVVQMTTCNKNVPRVREIDDNNVIQLTD